ncbi:Fra a 1-associated protein [Linum grandiflorum]
MGWVWRDDDESEDSKSSSATGEFNEEKKESLWSDQACSTKEVLRTSCKTEEVEPGRFVLKCEKTEEVLRECLGMPAEVLQSKKEYTEEDVTELMTKGPFAEDKHEIEGGPFTFPGLQSDISELERHFAGHFDRFLQAAEEMKSSLFDVFEGFSGENSSLPPSMRPNIPIAEERSHPKQEGSKNGYVDISGLSKEV